MSKLQWKFAHLHINLGTLKYHLASRGVANKLQQQLARLTKLSRVVCRVARASNGVAPASPDATYICCQFIVLVYVISFGE